MRSSGLIKQYNQRCRNNDKSLCQQEVWSYLDKKLYIIKDWEDDDNGQWQNTSESSNYRNMLMIY